MKRTFLLLAAILLRGGVVLYAESPEFLADSVVVPAGTFESPSAIWHLKKSESPRVFVWFHGGMQSAKCAKGYEAGKAMLPFLKNSRREAIVASASACKENHWLSREALFAVDGALDSAEARLGVRIDTVSLVGVSDGGLGVLGYSLYGRRVVESRLLVSTNLASVSDAANLARARRLRNGTWTFLQGGNDRLYPSSRTLPWLDAFCRIIGKSCRIRFDESGEHDWSWWSAHRPQWIQEFAP